ncbi:hypothetical protein [uncultured Parasphingorhabdus sp.]|uniref:hypothetical protein n=1 Tax=uncultured Parasphingorhabdus sp. TaxID=2709694 RepID=UPI0030D6F4BD|tara:strand:+ start:66570 stop:67181 length:612 start_codon:yes stop_codon:yes gene_type:complete
MLKSLTEYEETKTGSGVQELCETRRPHILPLAIALAYFAAPAPSLAEAGSGENVAIALSSSIVTSPVGMGDAARAVPGALVDYSVSVTGPLDNASPATSFAIIDMIPDQLSLFVGDLSQAGTGPAAFIDNDSGLEFGFDGLASLTDSIEFSSDGGATFDYTPVADADGFDQNVTHIKLRPRGALMPVNEKYERFSIRYRMKVK